MALRLIEVAFDDAHADTVDALLDGASVVDVLRLSADVDGRRLFKILVATDAAQQLTDRLQQALGGAGGGWRVTVLPVEATIPAAEGHGRGGSASREELYQDVVSGAEVNANYVLLTVLSVIVTGIGLDAGNVAVIIGAMVIAPLLGPNLALSLGAALGDLALIGRALRAGALGLGVTFVLSFVLGIVFEPDLDSAELISRTRVAPADLALALASGAAAALSMTTGLSSALVGVMVAVALMPPAVVVGFAAGAGAPGLAGGALLLLAVNVVCINVASQLVLVWKGVRPRTWLEQRKAGSSVRTNLALWGVILLLLVLLLALRIGAPG